MSINLDNTSVKNYAYPDDQTIVSEAYSDDLDKIQQEEKPQEKRYKRGIKKFLSLASVSISPAIIKAAIDKFKKNGLQYSSIHPHEKDIHVSKDQHIFDHPEIKKIAHPDQKTSHSDLADIAKISYIEPENILLLEMPSEDARFDNKFEENKFYELKEKAQNSPKRKILSFFQKANPDAPIRKELEQALIEDAKKETQFLKEFKEDNPNISFLTQEYQSKTSEESSLSKTDRLGIDLQSKVDKSSTGLDLIILENKDNNEVIVSFRGTDEAVDWVADAQMGKNQFQEIEKELAAYVKALSEEEPPKSITFTGQSLGGGLAEIAAYKSQEAQLDADISLVAFNGFGGSQTIEHLSGEIDDDILEKIGGTNYRTKIDPVSPFGDHITQNNIRLETKERHPIRSHNINEIRQGFNPDQEITSAGRKKNFNIGSFIDRMKSYLTT